MTNYSTNNEREGNETMAQKIPDNVVEEAWIRCKGQCECTNEDHYHGIHKCKTRLYKPSRGRDSRMGWEANLKDPDGPATLENCEILCHSCYTRTHSFGF